MKLALFLFLLTACSTPSIEKNAPALKGENSDDASNDSDDGDKGNEGAGKSDDKTDSGMVPSAGKISDLSYDAESHTLKFKVTIGGCSEPKFSIEIGDICLESFPMQCGSTLVQNKDFDSSCKKLIVQDVSHKLDPKFDTTVLSISNSNKERVEILVDRKGVTKNIGP